MTTAQQFGDYYYDSRYSPPVSPKSLPHGYKRKASTQDDELEKNSLISNSFKKLRLHSAKRLSAADLPPVGIAYRDVDPQPPSSSQYANAPGRDPSYARGSSQGSEDDGLMSIDDTMDRVWVHDLGAEIAQIEAEEEEARNKGEIHLSDAADAELSKIPQHLLKTNAVPYDAQSNMQMILYRDPISISVPEEHDAVRKTIIEARQRTREKQAESHPIESPPMSPYQPTASAKTMGYDGEDDGMDID